MRYVTSVVKQGLDRGTVDDVKADDVTAKVVARVNRHGVINKVIPQGLGQPFGKASVRVNVGCFPELLESGDLVAVLVTRYLVGLGVATVALLHDL